MKIPRGNKAPRGIYILAKTFFESVKLFIQLFRHSAADFIIEFTNTLSVLFPKLAVDTEKALYNINIYPIIFETFDVYILRFGKISDSGLDRVNFSGTTIKSP